MASISPTPANPSQNTSQNNQASPDKVVERAAEGAHKLVDQVADKAAPAVERVRETLAGAGDAISSSVVGLEEARRRWMESSRACVRQHPLTSIGIAVAVGWAFSRLRSRH